MNPKYKSREVALQILFQKPFSPEASTNDRFTAFVESFALEAHVKERARSLAFGVEDKEEEINKIIEANSDNWRIDRMALTDLIILQLGIFELCFFAEDETPPKLCVNDYIEITKKYSSAEAKNFINGVLDKVMNNTVVGHDDQ